MPLPTKTLSTLATLATVLFLSGCSGNKGGALSCDQLWEKEVADASAIRYTKVKNTIQGEEGDPVIQIIEKTVLAVSDEHIIEKTKSSMDGFVGSPSEEVSRRDEYISGCEFGMAQLGGEAGIAALSGAMAEALKGDCHRETATVTAGTFDVETCVLDTTSDEGSSHILTKMAKYNGADLAVYIEMGGDNSGMITELLEVR